MDIISSPILVSAAPLHVRKTLFPEFTPDEFKGMWNELTDVEREWLRDAARVELETGARTR